MCITSHMACYVALHNTSSHIYCIAHRGFLIGLGRKDGKHLSRITGSRFRQTSLVRFNVGSVSSNNPLGRPASGQRHRSLCQSGGLFGDHAQCLRLRFRSARKKLHHPQMHNSLGLDTKHCSVAGDLHPVLEQHVPPRSYLMQEEGQSQLALFVPCSDGDAPIKRALPVAVLESKLSDGDL